MDGGVQTTQHKERGDRRDVDKTNMLLSLQRQKQLPHTTNVRCEAFSQKPQHRNVPPLWFIHH